MSISSSNNGGNDCSTPSPSPVLANQTTLNYFCYFYHCCCWCRPLNIESGVEGLAVDLAKKGGVDDSGVDGGEDDGVDDGDGVDYGVDKSGVEGEFDDSAEKGVLKRWR